MVIKKSIPFIWVLLLPLLMQAQVSVADEAKRLQTRAKTACNVGGHKDALEELRLWNIFKKKQAKQTEI